MATDRYLWRTGLTFRKMESLREAADQALSRGFGKGPFRRDPKE